MDFDEIEPHQYIFLISAFMASLIGEVLSNYMIEMFYGKIRDSWFIFGYGTYWFALIPMLIIGMYIVIFGIWKNFISPNKSYQHKEETGLGYGDIYLYATPIVSLLLFKNLLIILGDIILVSITVSICFFIILTIYKWLATHR